IKQRKETKPKPPIPRHWLLTLITGGLLAIIIVGGISLVAYNFFPDFHINPGQGNLDQILKIGGFGLLATILGLIMLKNGFHHIFPARTVEEDDWLKPKKKRGCGTIMNGLGLLFFGFLFLAGGLILMTVVFYQDVLPWLGF
ncbi:hypothetical protein ACFLXI_07665, partial [Chloroflexota bacterium]